MKEENLLRCAGKSSVEGGDRIALSDIAYLDEEHLTKTLRSIIARMSKPTFLKAISSLPSSSLIHIRRAIFSIPRSDTSKSRSASNRIFDHDVLFARSLLFDLIFWEIVYRKTPNSYDIFVDCQSIPIHELFPIEAYRNKVVADVGCGTGRLIAHLSPAAHKVLGIDPTTPLIAFAKMKFSRHTNVEFLIGNFSNTNLRDNSVDHVVSSMAFSAQKERGGLVGLNELRRVVKPGGTIRIIASSAKTEAFLALNGFSPSAAVQPITWRIGDNVPTSVLQMAQRTLSFWSRELGSGHGRNAMRNFSDENSRWICWDHCILNRRLNALEKSIKSFVWSKQAIC